jgi:hypothetical protein
MRWLPGCSLRGGYSKLRNHQEPRDRSTWRRPTWSAPRLRNTAWLSIRKRVNWIQAKLHGVI